MAKSSKNDGYLQLSRENSSESLKNPAFFSFSKEISKFSSVFLAKLLKLSRTSLVLA